MPEVPDFLKPCTKKATAPLKKQKPGPKAGDLAQRVVCPYCGGKAHRKAVQTIKGVGAFRRHYCVDGCGHYHYRDVDTNEVVEVGQGPRECRLHKSESIESGFDTLAASLGIAVGSLKFTAKNDSGRPRALVNCLSAADISVLPTEEDQDNVQCLHRTLLVIQACIGVYRERAQSAAKRGN